VDIIASVGPLFDALHVDYERLGNHLWPDGQVSTPEDVTMGVMTWTAAARFQSEGKWEVDPIPVRLWEGLFPLLGHDAMEERVGWWAEGVLTGPVQRALAQAYFEPLFRTYAQEMAPFGSGRPPDPRLVRFFLFTEG
jgi:hypothetical protein